MGTMGRTYREVIGLTGPLLPVVSFLGRLPTATIQFGSVLLVARTSGSLTAAGLTGGALALGQVACGPLVGRLADRHGQRTVVLAFSSPTPWRSPRWSPERWPDCRHRSSCSSARRRARACR